MPPLAPHLAAAAACRLRAQPPRLPPRPHHPHPRLDPRQVVVAIPPPSPLPPLLRNHIHRPGTPGADRRPPPRSRRPAPAPAMHGVGSDEWPPLSSHVGGCAVACLGHQKSHCQVPPPPPPSPPIADCLILSPAAAASVPLPPTPEPMAPPPLPPCLHRRHPSRSLIRRRCEPISGAHDLPLPLPCPCPCLASLA